MAKLSWCPKRRLMCGFLSDQEEPVLKFDYSTFENIERGLVTPSMYTWMASWIHGQASERDVEIMLNLPVHGRELYMELTEDAHRAYHDMEWKDRLSLHEQTVSNLKSELRYLEEDERALLAAGNPFEHSSFLHRDYAKWAEGKLEEIAKRAAQAADELDEESLWEQGGDGMSETEGPVYDPMEE
jgi:hypothetical protein